MSVSLWCKLHERWISLQRNEQLWTTLYRQRKKIPKQSNCSQDFKCQDMLVLLCFMTVNEVSFRLETGKKTILSVTPGAEKFWKASFIISDHLIGSKECQINHKNASKWRPFQALLERDQHYFSPSQGLKISYYKWFWYFYSIFGPWSSDGVVKND